MSPTSGSEVLESLRLLGVGAQVNDSVKTDLKLDERLGAMLARLLTS